MLIIMLTYPNGQTETDTLQVKFNRLTPDEFLYRYLLKYTKLKAYSEGLPDEEQKVLKHFGVTYWEPGMERVTFNGITYSVLTSNDYALITAH